MQPEPSGHTLELFPLGVRTRIHSTDAGLLRIAADAYAVWAEPPVAAEDEPASVTIRLSVDAVDDGGRLDVRVDGPDLAMRGAGVDGRADAVRREAWCAVSPSVAADAHRAGDVLDTLVLFLVTRAGRVPLHASGFVAGETAFVLAGPSGTGKSTLALAAQRRGLHVLSDDTVYVQLSPVPRVWGFPRPIHVFPEQAPPADDSSLRLRSGKLKAAVPLASGPSRRSFADRSILVLLERGSEVRIEAVSVDQAVERMLDLLEPGFDHFRDQLPAAVRAVAMSGAYRLTLSADPEEAIAALLALGPTT